MATADATYYDNPDSTVAFALPVLLRIHVMLRALHHAARAIAVTLSLTMSRMAVGAPLDVQNINVGDIVFPAGDTQLQVSNKATANVHQLTVLEVLKTTPEWLWVTTGTEKGWLSRQQAIPMEERLDGVKRVAAINPSSAALANDLDGRCYLARANQRLHVNRFDDAIRDYQMAQAVCVSQEQKELATIGLESALTSRQVASSKTPANPDATTVDEDDNAPSATAADAVSEDNTGDAR